MKTVGVKWTLRCRSQPHVIVHTLGCRSIRFCFNGFHPPLIGPGLHGADLSQLTGFDIVERLYHVRLAALPLARLYDFVVSLLGCYHGSAFFDGVADGLLYVHIFAGGASVGHDQAMPMIRRTYNDYV